MKDLHGEASRTVGASVQQCLALLEDVAAYPSWYPDVVRGIEVLEEDGAGAVIRARAKLHAAAGPISRDLSVVLGVVRAPDRVTLSRVAHERTDRERFSVDWRVAPASTDRARIDLALDASLDVPRLVPLGGIGDAMAGGFVDAAARALERG